MDNQASTFANEKQMKADIRRRKINELKSQIRMLWHSIFWKTLWTLHLGRAYSKLACKFGFYEKFQDGRCMYCGEVVGHG